MKFSCKTSDFLQALGLVSRAISSQQALPILGNILISVEGKRCTLSATDLEISIITSFEASIENEGSITVPAKAILNFAQYNTDQDVLLETSEGTQLKCTSKHTRTLIAGEASSEYPTISPIKKNVTFSLDPIPLLNALNLVTFTCARSTLRPVLSGVYVHVEKGKLVFVGTDSYRLSEYKTNIQTENTNISCIVPVKVLEELKLILGGRKAGKKSSDTKAPSNTKESPISTPVECILSNQQIEIHIDQTRLLSRLIEGKFPDYNQIIPLDQTTKAILPTKELLTAVKRMHFFTREVNNNLSFHFTKKEIHLKTPQTQSGKDEETISLQVDGKENKIALSSSFLLDFLTHIDNDSIEVSLTDSVHPAVFRLPGDSSFLHLIMPLRAQD
jgi:DNA polymerase III subunit beta